MRKIRIYVVATAVASLGLIPAASPANASHSCAIDDPTLDAICEGAHDIPQILLCKVAPKLCA